MKYRSLPIRVTFSIDPFRLVAVYRINFSVELKLERNARTSRIYWKYFSSCVFESVCCLLIIRNNSIKFISKEAKYLEDDDAECNTATSCSAVDDGDCVTNRFISSSSVAAGFNNESLVINADYVVLDVSNWISSPKGLFMSHW